MASTYLTNTAGTPTNTKIMTFSVWFKIGTSTNQRSLISSVEAASGGSYTDLKIMNASTHKNVFRFECKTTEGNYIDLKFNRSLRDPSAWYHLVISVDTTQTTASDRTKIYINGVQETSFATATYPVQNHNLDFSKSGLVRQIGAYDNTVHWDGSMSHIHFVDGTAYAASTFGSTDSTTGEWTINTSPSVTYGNNGFFVLKDGNTITDSSPNSNNFALAAGTLTKIEDCPDNNFATNNPICNVAGRWTMTNGNNTIQHANSSAWTAMMSSIAPFVGKYYMEAKITGGSSRAMFGVMSTDTDIMGYQTNLNTICLYYNLSGGEFQQSGGVTSGNNYGTFADNDIAGIALDCTNKYISIYKNGSALVTNHTIPATVTGSIGFGFTSDSNSTVYQCNYGNGYYGTTAVTTNSGNGYAGAEGKSIFSYQPPTNYSALNTRGLNE